MFTDMKGFEFIFETYKNILIIIILVIILIVLF